MLADVAGLIIGSGPAVYDYVSVQMRTIVIKICRISMNMLVKILKGEH